MGLNHSPRIITDGLTLYIDAANTKSYTGTGTSVADISLSAGVGTLTNGASFNDSNKGSFIFDGLDDYISVPFNSDAMDFSLGQTICIWMKPFTGSSSARRNPYNQAYGGSGTITHEPSGAFNYYFGTNGGNGTPYTGRTSGFTVTSEETAFISVMRDQTLNVCRWFKNGEFTNSSNAGGYASTNNGSTPIWVGDGYVAGFLGEIYLVAVYNRGLSDSEIQNNFQATRSRFGI